MDLISKVDLTGEVGKVDVISEVDLIGELCREFIATIPVAQIKRRFGKLFNIEQTGTTPTTKIENVKELTLENKFIKYQL